MLYNDLHEAKHDASPDREGGVPAVCRTLGVATPPSRSGLASDIFESRWTMVDLVARRHYRARSFLLVQTVVQLPWQS
jgi:hypothetical protein